MSAIRHWGCFASLALAAIACGTGQSDDVNQQRIYQVYRVQLDDASRSIDAQASFHYESPLGTSLRLSDASSVQFAGQPMRISTFLGMTHYEAREDSFTQSFGPLDFRYVNNEGEVFTVQALLPPPLTITSPREGSRVNLDQELVVRLQGQTWGDHQDVKACLKVEKPSMEPTPVDECLYLRGVSTIVFSREQLEKFRNQTVSLQLTRTHNPPQNNQRIQLTVERSSQPITLYF